MVFESGKNRLELQILGYQFPDNVTGHETDLNWLVIGIAAHSADGAWETENACLLTWEVARLVVWLRRISDGEAVEASLGFLEPNLECLLVEYSSGEAILDFVVSHEFRPPWMPCSSYYTLRFVLTHASIRQAADALEADLSRYPKRQHVRK